MFRTLQHFSIWGTDVIILSNLEVQRPEVNIVCGLDSGEDASGSRLSGTSCTDAGLERAASSQGHNETLLPGRASQYQKNQLGGSMKHLVVLFVVAGSLLAYSQTSTSLTGQIKGRVIDRDGSP